MRRFGRFGIILAASISLLAAACGGSSSNNSASSNSNSNSNSNSGSTAKGTVTISNEAGALWTCGFNPFNGSVAFLSQGFVYEPLVYINPLQNGKTTPLARHVLEVGLG